MNAEGSFSESYQIGRFKPYKGSHKPERLTSNPTKGDHLLFGQL